MAELNFSVHPYRIPLTRPLPVGKQRLGERRGLIVAAKYHAQGENLEGNGGENDGENDVENYIENDGENYVKSYAEIAPLSGEDMDGAPILGFSPESLAQCQQLLTDLLPGIQTLDELEAAAETVPLASVAWGLGVLAATLRGQLLPPAPMSMPTPIPLMYLKEGEPTEPLLARVKALPADSRFVKIKVAQTSMETELKLVHAILAARPQLKLRLDANQGFSLDEAIEFCACLPLEALDYIEEPCLNPNDNPALFRATGAAFALDESLTLQGFHFPEDPEHYGLRALVLKPMLLGSPAQVQDLIDKAHALGIRCIISSSLESSLGIAALAAFAAVTTPDEAPGLDTQDAFEADCIIATGKPRLLHPDQPSAMQGAEIGASIL